MLVDSMKTGLGGARASGERGPSSLPVPTHTQPTSVVHVAVVALRFISEPFRVCLLFLGSAPTCLLKSGFSDSWWASGGSVGSLCAPCLC